MKRRSTTITVLLMMLALLGGFGHLSVSAQTANAPVCMEFEKTLVDLNGVWEGTVTGDVTGDLTTMLQSISVDGPIWHVTFLWIVDAGAESFAATLGGILNTTTGGVVMNGTVTDGWLLGAQVHEQGQAQDPDGIDFAGTICIMPASSE